MRPFLGQIDAILLETAVKAAYNLVNCAYSSRAAVPSTMVGRIDDTLWVIRPVFARSAAILACRTIVL